MADYKTPCIDKPIEIPVLEPGVMEHLSPYVASAEHQQALGFPGDLVDDWQNKAIEKFAELLGKSRALRVYMDSCVKCGACTDKCQFFLGSADPKNMPVARQDLMRKVYRRNFTWTGKIVPWLVGAEDLTEEVLDDWYSYFHQCSQCRRCSVYCPYGIDTAEISMAAREIMDHIGKGQKYCNEILGKVHTIGNNLGLPEKALRHTMEDLEEDIEEETGLKVRLPVNEKGADILLVTPSADFFAEPHIDGLIGYAKVFHPLPRRRWTTGTPISTNAPSAGAVRHFVPTVSIPLKYPWRRARSWITSARGRNTVTKSSARFTRLATTLACLKRR